MAHPSPPPCISDPGYLRRTRKRAWLRGLLSVLGIASVFFAGWLQHKTHILIPKPKLHWMPKQEGTSPHVFRLYDWEWDGIQYYEGNEATFAVVLADTLNINLLTELFHDSALAKLEISKADKKWQSRFFRRFRGWESQLRGPYRLRTMAGSYGDSCLILQTIDTLAEFDPERRLESRGWLRSTGIGYPWVILWVATLLLSAVVIFMLFVHKGFLWSMRVEPPDSVETIPADNLVDRLRTLVPLAENRGFHERSPGVFECAWSKRGKRTRKLREYDVESNDWMRLRLDESKSTVFLISGSRITTTRSGILDFFRAREWMRSAGHLPITPVEGSWIVWDGNQFQVTRTRDQDISQLAQAISHCALDSGWTMQPHLW